ncbi:MAG: UDP-glucose 4-epimerase GalE [Nitrospinae bacterium]|nr:UDP-glucose 4-epimerase GalE [Nitrospinota bacterium]
MNVLIAGGAGYIGSLAVRRLLDAGHLPVVIDDLSTGKRESIPAEAVFYHGDVADAALLDSIFKRFDARMVMHFAAKISVEESVSHPDRYYLNNVSKTLVLLERMFTHSVKKIIFSSTAAVYGQPLYLPIDEDHPVKPTNPYGASKQFVETILRDYHSAFGLDCVIFRYFNAAGASLDGKTGECRKEKRSLIPVVLENLEKKRESVIFGDDWDTPDGTCIRDYVHVEDVVSAHVGAMKLFEKGGVFEVVNLGSEVGSSVKDVLDAVAKASRKEVAFRVGARRPGDWAKVVASGNKAEALLGWRPKYSDLETIVNTAYQWHFNRLY